MQGARQSGGRVDIEPGDRWRIYEKEIEMEPGYTEIRIRMEKGEEPDQVLWVDEMEFGPVAP